MTMPSPHSNASEGSPHLAPENDAGVPLTRPLGKTVDDSIGFPPPPDGDHYDFLAPSETPGDIGQIGPYRVLGLLGKGGMGMVFRAVDPQLEREVALKVILPKFATRLQARQRFLREARAIAAIDHLHIVPIFHVGEGNGVPYLVMPMLKGHMLSTAMKQTPRLCVRELIRIGREVAEGLAAAHERNIVHRDIKPGNVWLAGEMRSVRLLDFGLARPVEQENTSEPLTVPGEFVGTPAYASPEQARGEPVDAASDLFSLGVLMYQMATGVSPFAGPTVQGVLTAVATEHPEPPVSIDPEVPQVMNDLIMRLLAKEPCERPPSAKVVAEELRRMERTLTAMGPEIQPANSALESGQEGPTMSGAGKPEVLPSTIRAGGWRWLMALVVVLLVLGVLGLRTREWDRGKDPKDVPAVTGMPRQGEQYTNSLGMAFVGIEPGNFLMGSPDGQNPPGVPEETGRVGDETPHRVTLTRGYYLGATLVTQRQWERVMGKEANHSEFPGKSEDEKSKLPVDNVSWYDCVDFCNRLSSEEGRSPAYRLTNMRREGGGLVAADVELLPNGTGYRLPTEAEWEYAARAGTQTAFWWGDTINTDQANYDGTQIYGKAGKKGEYRKKTTPVDQFQANRWGLRDMGGNLFQWCGDYYDRYHEENNQDPLVLARGIVDCRVARGGSWIHGPERCRAALRGWFPPADRRGFYGCRIAVDRY